MVLAESKEPMTTKAMIEQMATKGLWSSPNRQTPAATLYSAILLGNQHKVEGVSTKRQFSENWRGSCAFARQFAMSVWGRPGFTSLRSCLAPSRSELTDELSPKFDDIHTMDGNPRARSCGCMPRSRNFSPGGIR